MPYTLLCPHCQKQVELTEAFRHQIEAEMLTAERAKHQLELQQTRMATDEKLASELQLVKDQLDQKAKQLELSQAAELEIRKLKLVLEEEKRTFELDKQRAIDVERETIRQKTIQAEAEKHHLIEREKEKIISDLKLALEDAQRKANQGSQQLQGEVQELDFKLKLQESFPDDLIEDVEKGIRGADISQTVRSTRGYVCGAILWESKRTKTWSDDWLSKLKDDLRSTKANIPVIVTSAMPKDCPTLMDLRDGVWIVSYPLAVPLAFALRDKLIDLAKQNYFAKNQGTKADLIYSYVTGHEFINQIQALVEIYQETITQIGKEKAAFERIWKSREGQAQRLITNTGRIYGSLHGIAGTALPSVPGLDLLE